MTMMTPVMLPPKISLEAARVNARMLQKEAADALGVATATLRSWESGDTMPDIDKAVQLAELYKYPIDYIFFGKR